MNAPVLEIDGLHVSLRGERREPDRLVLRGVDLAIMPGEVHALVGESGAGKSMIARTVLGILPHRAQVASGRVRLLGHDWLAMPHAARRVMLGRDVSLIPQDPMSALSPAHTIERQVCEVLRLHLPLSAQAARERALALLEAVRIREPARVLQQYPHELSGGMRQRVLIAIAFACGPRLIVADEPTTALDVTVQREVLRLLRSMQQRGGGLPGDCVAGGRSDGGQPGGTVVLFITHNLGLVAKLADRISVIHGGRIVERGLVREIFDAPHAAYTRALFAATPRHDRPAEALRPIDPAVVAALDAESAAYDRAWARPR